MFAFLGTSIAIILYIAITHTGQFSKERAFKHLPVDNDISC